MKILRLLLKVLKYAVISAVVLYALLWIFSFKTYDTELGVSFSPDYARFLGLNAEETYDAILNDLHPSTIRLAVHWNKVEKSRGVYDFSELDIMLKKAAKFGAKVVLVVGQKAPRWPECYIPEWSQHLGGSEATREALLEYVQKTVEHYKNNPVVELWQVENEPYLPYFGECAQFDRKSFKDEVALVRSLDASRSIMVTESGELSTYYRAANAGDVLGTTLYRTVRLVAGKSIVARYDWLPAAYYKIRARLWGKDLTRFYVAELQAEPWFSGAVPNDKETLSMDKTFSPARFKQNIKYAQKVGASRVYLWGVEWWYFMKVKIDDERYWDTAKEIFKL